MPLNSLMELDASAVEDYDEAQHDAPAASSAAAAASAAGGGGEDSDDDDDDDDVGGGKRAKGKRPMRKKGRATSAAAAASAAAANDDGGGKMSAEELQAAQGHAQQPPQPHHAAASAAAAASASSSSLASTTAVTGAAGAAGAYGGAISLPPVAFPPTADEDTLRALPPPVHPAARDARLPSLDPAFLGHVYAMTKVLSAKITALLADMAATLRGDPGAKFVVFSQFTDSLDTLASVLADRGYACATISSHTAKAERQRAVSAFSTNPRIQVILVSMGTGAAGLTLTAASTVYLLEPTHSPADEAQALNRAHRIGQRRPVRCLILFCKGTVEERMLAARRRADNFMSVLENESAALTSVGSHGGRDAEKKAHFSLAGFQELLGMNQ